MTTDLNQYYDALRKADAAGDTAAATKLTQFIQQKQTPAPSVAPAGGIGSDLAKRGQNIQDIKANVQQDKTGAISGGLQQAGEAAGAGMDVVGEVAKAGFKALPDAVQKPIAAVGNAVGAVGRGAMEVAGKLPAVGGGTIGEKIPQELAANPNLSKDLGAIGNIATLFGPAKAIEGATAIGRTGEALQAAGKAQAVNKRDRFISDLVSPAETKKVAEAQVGRTTEEGPLRSQVAEPTPQEKAMAAEVKKIPGIKNTQSAQANYNLIQNETSRINKRLDYELRSLKDPLQNMTGNMYEFKNRINQSVQQLIKEHPILVGEAAATAKRLIPQFYKIVESNPPTLYGLHKSRQQFDSYVKDWMGQGFFEPGKQGASKIVVRALRDATNKFIAEKAPDVSVKESLMRQHHLLSAMDNIEPKAAAEGKDIIQRLAKKVSAAVSLKGSIVGATGLGALGLTHLLSPGMVIGPAGLYLAGKALTSAETKQVLGGLLKTADSAIKHGHDLRADRAALVDYMKGQDNENPVP